MKIVIIYDKMIIKSYHGAQNQYLGYTAWELALHLYAYPYNNKKF